MELKKINTGPVSPDSAKSGGEKINANFEAIGSAIQEMEDTLSEVPTEAETLTLITAHTYTKEQTREVIQSLSYTKEQSDAKYVGFVCTNADYELEDLMQK